MGRLLPVLLLIGFTVYTLVDCIQTDESQQRNLPKLVWILLIILVTPVGGVAWLIAGRPHTGTGSRPGPTRPTRPTGPRGPDDDPDFLRGL